MFLVRAGERAVLAVVEHGVRRVPVFHDLEPAVDLPAQAWGGGLVASADGVRFTVPVQTLYAGSDPRYFGLRHKAPPG